MPDGTLLSMPIPAKDDGLTYADIAFNGVTYESILKQLCPQKNFGGCHLDPDIRAGARLTMPDHWEPAFGQIDSAQGVLRNGKVSDGDLFIFFGCYRQTELADNCLRYKPDSPPLHVVFGYLQVARVLTEPDKIAKYSWHPHAIARRLANKTNALYLPGPTLSFDESKPGYGVFNFDEKRVLTMQQRPMSTWTKIPALMPDNLTRSRANCSDEGIYYCGPWQELVLKENDLSEAWVKSLFD
jgi:hypothetical protein